MPILNAAGLAGYLLATLAASARLHYRLEQTTILHYVSLSCAVLALIAHTAVLYPSLFTGTGLDLGFYNALVLVTWLLMLLQIVILRYQVSSMLILLCPVCALSLGLQPILHTPYVVLLPSLLGFGLQIHIVLSVLSYSILSFAALVSLILHAKHQGLRKNRWRRLCNTLPPVQHMERLLMQLILIGFFLLSLSLTSGVVFLHDILAQHLVHKTFFSFLAWSVYGILLWGRWRAGWRGSTLTTWSLSGMALLALSYFGTKLVLELLLGRT